MRTSRVIAAVSAVTLAGAVLAGTAGASAAPQVRAASTDTTTALRGYVVLVEHDGSTAEVSKRLTSLGGTVTDVNKAIGMVTVTSTRSGFRAKALKVARVLGVATDRSIGQAAARTKGPDPVEQENLFTKSRANGSASIPAPPAGGDPYDGLLWGMRMTHAVEAHAVNQGDHRVRVGILDTGVDATHLDIAPNFDHALSRNFTTDIPAIDGPCEHPSCVDPATEDDNGHGTHVSGTIGGALNGIGVSGVAPGVDIVNIRGGQDSGYFFLSPVVNALTYAGDSGIDVVNMSFYVDPWLYNCLGGAVEDRKFPEAVAEQETIIALMNRALDYAHGKGVTLVAALGNDHDDIAKPRHDLSSPDYDNPIYTWDNAAYQRTITNATCFDLPVEGPHVIGVSSVGPSGTKSDFSNWTSDLTSGEIEVSAPGGWYRDGFGTSTYRTNGNLILSSVPLVSLTDSGEVDKNGNITKLGRDDGVLKQCANGKHNENTSTCSYYAWYQGTSMASPHASGVAALAVAAHGTASADGLTLAPDTVRQLVMSTATDHACPAGGVLSYTNEERDDTYTATCVGTTAFNGLYGDGIVNALGVVR